MSRKNVQIRALSLSSRFLVDRISRERAGCLLEYLSTTTRRSFFFFFFFCLKPSDSSKNNRRKEAEFYGFVISQKSYQRRYEGATFVTVCSSVFTIRLLPLSINPPSFSRRRRKLSLFGISSVFESSKTFPLLRKGI